MQLVTAALLLHEGRLLLAQRAANDPLAHKWEFPGGKVEAGESPEECLNRELHEEFAITTHIGQHFATSDYDYGTGTLRILAYWATWTNGTLQPKVHAQTRWVPPRDAHEYDLLPADIPIAQRLKEQHEP